MPKKRTIAFVVIALLLTASYLGLEQYVKKLPAKLDQRQMQKAENELLQILGNKQTIPGNDQRTFKQKLKHLLHQPASRNYAFNKLKKHIQIFDSEDKRMRFFITPTQYRFTSLFMYMQHINRQGNIQVTEMPYNFFSIYTNKTDTPPERQAVSIAQKMYSIPGQYYLFIYRMGSEWLQEATPQTIDGDIGLLFKLENDSLKRVWDGFVKDYAHPSPNIGNETANPPDMKIMYDSASQVISFKRYEQVPALYKMYWIRERGIFIDSASIYKEQYEEKRRQDLYRKE